MAYWNIGYNKNFDISNNCLKFYVDDKAILTNHFQNLDEKRDSNEPNKTKDCMVYCLQNLKQIENDMQIYYYGRQKHN
jgi:hypothetical protein